MITIATIKKLEERYPFNEAELEVLIRCHDKLSENDNKDDFLTVLAKALPYSSFFLPGDEMSDRVDWIEEHILPMGFSSRLRCALATDSFVDYANSGENRVLERLIEGIAKTGRRGTVESLNVTYDVLDEDATAEGLVELCLSMAIASECLVIPNLDKKAAAQRLQDAKPCILSMARSLTSFCEGKKLNKRNFVNWAELKFPLLSSTLSSFVHNLLFHGHAYPKTRVQYVSPKIYETSEIFKTETSPLLLSLSFANIGFGGKWHKLYSSDSDGRSFTCLEKALLGFTGPTISVVKTTENSVLGAYTAMPWKESLQFIGDSESFLFQLSPILEIYRAEGNDENFAYLHTTSGSSLIPRAADHDLPAGLGFGGTFDKPRFFIPESLEHCSARFFDKTYEMGDLLPDDALERFEISTMEIWATGGDEMIQKALRDQADYRERHEEYLMNARVVHDKKEFVKDFESGLISNALFAHKQDSRGRPDFAVDDEHGGYKVEREEFA